LKDDVVRQGAVLNEAMHVCFLNFMCALLCPMAGKHFNFVIAGHPPPHPRNPTGVPHS
jgi:hypothetical protein